MSRTVLHRQVKRWLRLAAKLPEEGSQRQNPMDRRQFIHGVGKAALLTVPGVLPSPFAFAGKSNSTMKAVPLSIVGGGLAGLCTSYTLAKAGLRAEVFEASKRCGGRIRTRQNFYQEGLFCEEGGEFIDSDHHALQGLAAELNIPLQDLRSQDRGVVQEYYFFDGKRYYEKDVIAAFAPLSRILRKDTQALFRDDEFFVPTIFDRSDGDVRRLDETSLAAYLHALKSEVESWVLELIKVAYIGEYGLDPEQQSALNLLILIDPKVKEGFRIFGESDEGFRLQGGNERIIQALQERLVKFDIPLHLEHRLVAVKEHKNHVSLIFDVQGKTLEQQTQNVIFAVPFTTLREVEGIDKISLKSSQRKAILGLGYGSNSKLIMATTSRFWRESTAAWQASNGSLFTDLPSQSFWESSRMQNTSAGILTCYLGGKSGLAADADTSKQVLSDLAQIYPGSAKHFTDTIQVANWSQNPFAKGSYSCPMPGQYTSMIGACSRPKKSDRYLFVGEHCSVDYGGFMNGAISSSLQVAATLLSGS
ncbi:MAG: flavin monoamine oxidase family protein [Oligoflexus sp.]